MKNDNTGGAIAPLFLLKLCKFFGQKVWYYISIGLRKSKALSQLSTSDNGWAAIAAYCADGARGSTPHSIMRRSGFESCAGTPKPAHANGFSFSTLAFCITS